MENEVGPLPLSDVGHRIITELQNGSIRDIVIFTPEDFTNVVSLAAGGRCEISRAILRGHRAVAIKAFKHKFVLESLNNVQKEEKLVQYFIRECGTWKSVDSHSNIVTVLGFVEMFHGNSLPAIVTELYDLCDLRKYVNETSPPVSNSTRLRLLIDACAGLTYIHSKSVFHRDIKASNILLSYHDGRLKAAIGDFGSAKLEDPNIFRVAKSTANTSLAWTSPEYVTENGLDYSLPTSHGDIWSFGCTILEVLTGEDPWPPFQNVKRRLLARQHPPRPENLKDGIWEILVFCWHSEPARRKPASVISRLLQKQLDIEE